jgi:quercetin dioxygenase-like cupin family protein
VSDFTILRAGDAPDYTGGKVPSPFLGYARPMGAEQIAFNVRVLAPGATHVPPGWDESKGHSHNTIEELYFVIDGEITVKLDDEVVTLAKRDAVLMAPGTIRGVRNLTAEEAAFAMVSIKVEDAMAESNQHEDHWPTG